MKKEIKDKTIICILLIVVQSIIYGVHDPIVKIAYQSISVYLFLFVRYLIAAVFLFVIWRKQIVNDLKCAPLKNVVLAGLCLAVAYIFVNVALGMTEATTVAFLRSLSAIFASIILMISLRRRPVRSDILLWLVLIVGLGLMFKRESGFDISLGAIFALIGAMLVASSLVFSGEALKHVSPVTLSFTQALISTVLCFCMMIIKGQAMSGEWQLFVQPYMIFAALYAGFGVVVLGYILQNYALKSISADTVGILQCLYPITTAVVAPLLLHEYLSSINLIGATVVIGCIICECIRKKRKFEN